MKTTPIFIVGIGRSGTSLLQSIIGSHSSIATVPETAFLRRYLINDSFDLQSRSNWQKLELRMSTDSRLQRLDAELRDLFLEQTGSPGIARYRAVADLVCKTNKTTFFCDKDPRLIESIPWLCKNFEDLRILLIYRDPRDVLASKLNASWSANNSAVRHCLTAYIQHRLAAKSWNNQVSSKVMTLRYEDLLESPVDSIRDVCEHLDLEFEDGMLDFSGTAREIVSKEEMQWKKETLGPLLPGNAGKWSKELSQVQVAFCESVVREIFQKYGYPLSDATSSFNLFTRTFIRFYAGLTRFAGRVYCRVNGVKT